MTHNNSTASNVILSDLPYGYIYIVKSPSDIFNWELKNVPNLEYFTTISQESLVYSINYPDVFTSTKYNYAWIYLNNFKLPLNLSISNRVRLFIWVPSVNGITYNESANKLFDTYKNEPYRIVELTSNTYNNHPYFKDLSSVTSSSLDNKYKTTIPIILEEYKSNPIKLNYLLSNANLLTSFHLTQDIMNIANVLRELAKPQPHYSILKYIYTLPKSTLTELIIRPKLKYTLLYKLVKGVSFYTKNNYDDLESFNCPSLWVWFDILFSRLPSKYYNYPEYILRLFFGWIYSTNTYYSSSKYRGFYSYIKYKKINYNFEPSELAIKEFYKLF